MKVQNKHTFSEISIETPVYFAIFLLTVTDRDASLEDKNDIKCTIVPEIFQQVNCNRCTICTIAQTETIGHGAQLWVTAFLGILRLKPTHVPIIGKESLACTASE